PHTYTLTHKHPDTHTQTHTHTHRLKCMCTPDEDWLKSSRWQLCRSELRDKCGSQEQMALSENSSEVTMEAQVAQPLLEKRRHLINNPHSTPHTPTPSLYSPT